METDTISRKHALILKHEEDFARSLAIQVLDKPKLSVWMILIPIIFVHYIYQIQRYNAGRKAFAEHYLVSRKRALDHAKAAIETEEIPDINQLATISKLSNEVKKNQAEVFSILMTHFMNLFRAEGNDFDDLVRSAYGNLTNYLLFLNRLNFAEKVVNANLSPRLEEDNTDVNHVIANIERESERLRRISAEKIFS